MEQPAFDPDAVTYPIQLTQTIHRTIYPLLNPSNPALAAAGKTVLITGVSGGVGKVIAEAWAIAGAAAIFITGRKVEVLEAVATTLRSIPAAANTKIVVDAADLRSKKEVRDLWAKAGDEIGRVDVLINDAGVFHWGGIGSMEPSEWWEDYVRPYHHSSHTVWKIEANARCGFATRSECQRNLPHDPPFPDSETI